MGPGFPPLDEELALLPGSLAPSLVQSLVRLGTYMPFEPAAQMLAHFTRVEVGEATARRMTEKAGAAYVAVQTAELEKLKRESPMGPEGPALQQLSVDGAMVPLLHKEWAEVRTLAIGTVRQRLKDGEWEPHTEELSYFSRLADHMSFAELATVETHRRGTARAELVAGVVDGAEWGQVFIDLHRPDAVRILDWGHSSGYVAAAARAVFGVGTAQSAEWLRVQLHELKHGDPGKVLAKLRGIKEELALAGGEALAVVSTSLEYLGKRADQIRYAEFIAAGYPIGSGIVESANKLVVEARLKGAGMHWERRHVDPMVALRNVACSGRWEEAWPQIAEFLRAEPKRRSAARREERKAAKRAAQEAAAPTMEQPEELGAQPTARSVRTKAVPARVTGQATPGPRRPASDHPWRRMPVGRAASAPTSTPCTVPEM